MIKLSNLLMESISGLEIKPITKHESEQFILNHYLGVFPGVSKYYFGVFLNNELIGCVIYGYPSNPYIADYLAIDPVTNEPIVKNDEVYELTRLYIIDKPDVKNIESSVLAKSNKLLHDIDKKVKVVITYADPSVGHVGSIYQATNAIYQGKGMDKNQWMVKVNGREKVLRRKQLNALLNATGKGHLISGSTEDILKSGLPIYRKNISGKHRYIYILRDKKNIEPNLKLKPQTYPKKDTVD